MLTMEPGRFPFKIWTDEGSEFKGEFNNFCVLNQIEIYHTFIEIKNSLAERCIRTLKTTFYTIFEKSGPYKYINFIQKLGKLLKSRINRSNRMTPVKVKERDADKMLQMLKAEAVAL